ncbi:nucleotide-diphospho-sugar transferase [Clohesyomyces aquaticus]|uniref:Nucleotide-diphospho-sugar transferase n=1 Tax=Clohesyomyces aquaticus TaxID=1231657 RepID=A0A1Y1ZGA5_9PLEO|nr:nucleotide-diphospho-sugar transferase [Clohesyomyces aquaticus]
MISPKIFITVFLLIVIFYLSCSSGQSASSLPTSEYAIATFLTGQADDATYLTAARVLTYQLIHAPDTKINTTSISFLVLCSPTVPLSHKLQLQKDGASVVEVEDVPVNWWIRSGVTRWREQFTKLRIFEMTEYSRVLFVDADTMLLEPLDAIFTEPEVVDLAHPLLDRKKAIKKDEAQLPAEWLFAARSDNAFTGERAHPVPPLQTNSFSAGFWICAPDKQIFAHLRSIMGHWRRFDPHTMEQSLLNYVFRRDGAMPWRELGWKWSATWPSERDRDMGVKSLHEKFWKTGPEELQKTWTARKDEMEALLGTLG